MCRNRALGLALLLLLLRPACSGGQAAGGDDGSADGGHGGDHAAEEEIVPPVDGAAEATVRAVDIDFDPATLELTAGEPLNVTVVNDGSALHDFTFDEAGVHLNLEPGESKTTSVVVGDPGTYEVRCTVPGHADAGMTIDVVVT